MGKAERIWEVAHLLTLAALPCSSAVQGSQGGPMFEFPPFVASGGDAPYALEPCDPMPIEIPCFSERSRIVELFFLALLVVKWKTQPFLQSP